jgi:hypothetical protein
VICVESSLYPNPVVVGITFLLFPFRVRFFFPLQS